MLSREPSTPEDRSGDEREDGQAARGSSLPEVDRPWHAMAPGEAVEALASSDSGLDAGEVERRRRHYGKNRLPRKRRTSLLGVILRQFKDPLVYVLLAAGAVSLGIGNLSNAIFIFAVLALNTTIGTIQEWKAEGSAEALQEVIRIESEVTRGGERQTVESARLVPGDIVHLTSGDSVPADIRLLEAKDLRVDESLLTGESTPVDKSADAELDEETPLGDRTTMLHTGSPVLNGRARGIVCRTGRRTEVGKIAKSLTEEAGELPPLVVRLKSFTRKIALFVLLAIGLLSAVQLLQGAPPVRIFFLGVALAVSAIPAGLPVATTVALAIASRRMARRRVIVRLLPAVEGLGTCTVIASDKTGTLTVNELTLKRLQLPDGTSVEVGGEGLEPEGRIAIDGGEPEDRTRESVRRAAETGALCNEARYSPGGDGGEPEGDAVDLAFLVFAAKLGLSQGDLTETHERVGVIPFESERRYAASFHRHDGGVGVHVKGAAETVLPMCRDVDQKALEERHEALAKAGYRVLTLAVGEVDEAQVESEESLNGLAFLGFVGLIDPIRPEVHEAVGRCRRAGIDLRMITGDHPATGMAIARELGIGESEDEVVTGSQLGEAGDEEGAERIRSARVFARIEPAQKTRIVEVLQDAGEYIAVTGDGVNDAPALRAANIGVAMGKAGTDVARNAADLIITDDNFASIVNGVEEGRVAYDNFRKVTWLLIATGAAEVLLFFLSVFVGLPLPLDPVQLLWLNLVTNGIQDVALPFEKGDPDVLDRPPRPPRQPIFDGRMIRQTLLSGGYIGLVAFAAYFFMLRNLDLGEFEARNLLLLLMVLFENVHIFSCRSETRTAFQVPLRDNPFLIVVVVLAQGVHIASMYIPGLKDALEVQPVTITSWLVLLGIAVTLVGFESAAKWVEGRSSRRSAAAA